MGQAKLRGSFDDRVNQAKEKEHKESVKRMERILALKKKEEERVSNLSPEERENELREKIKAKQARQKANLLLTSALVVGAGNFT